MIHKSSESNQPGLGTHQQMLGQWKCGNTRNGILFICKEIWNLQKKMEAGGEEGGRTGLGMRNKKNF